MRIQRRAATAAATATSMPPLSVQGNETVTQLDIVLAESIARVGDSKKDRTLTDWLVANYGKAFY